MIEENDILLNSIDKLGIQVINLDKELFKKVNNPLKYFAIGPKRRSVHNNEIGYKAMSKIIYNKINKFED